MPLQHAADIHAKDIIVLERANLGHPSKAVEGFVVQLVDLVELRVRHDTVRQCLHVADAVGEPGRGQPNEVLVVSVLGAAASRVRRPASDRIRLRGKAHTAWAAPSSHNWQS